jgi:hypothetical protein
VFVSHNLGAISRLCSRALVLNAGAVAFDGPVSEALATYSKISRDPGRAGTSSYGGPLDDRVTPISFTINGSDELVGHVIKPESTVEIEVTAEILMPLKKFRVTVGVSKGGQLVLGLHDVETPCDISPGIVRSSFVIPEFFLSPGEYSVDVTLYSDATGEWLMAPGLALFSVSTEWHPLYEPTHGMGIVNIHQAGKRILRD